jgi:hypothetical protein
MKSCRAMQLNVTELLTYNILAVTQKVPSYTLFSVHQLNLRTYRHSL